METKVTVKEKAYSSSKFILAKNSQLFLKSEC